MKFLSSLFPGKTSASTPDNATTRAVGGNYGTVTSLSGDMDVERAVRTHYERCQWVYRCVDSIASKTSALPIVFRQGGKTDKATEAMDNDLDRILNRRANKFETGSRLRYRISTLANVSPKGVFLELIRSKSKGLSELYILPPGRVEPIPDPKNYVAGYKISNGVDGVDFLDPEQVLWIRPRPHPIDPYMCMTPLMAAGITADMDYLARLFNRNFLMNDGRPGMLVTVQDLMPTDADILRERFSGGVSNAGMATIIEGNGIDIADMSTSPRDSMWTESLATARDDILAAFGVPMIAFGSSNEKTFDNADAESVSYWTETLVPHMTTLGEFYDYLTPGGIDDEMYVVHNTDSVHSLQETKRLRKAELQNEVTAGVRTINSYREEIGEEPYDFPEANVLWLSGAIVPAGSEADVKAIQAKAPGAALAGGIDATTPQSAPPSPPPPEVTPPSAVNNNGNSRVPNQIAARNSNRNMRQLAAAETQRTLASIASRSGSRPAVAGTLVKRPRGHKTPGRSSSESASAGSGSKHPYGPKHAEVTGNVAGTVRAWADRQIRTASERLGGQKARKHTRHWVSDISSLEYKALDAAYIVNKQRWIEDLAASLHSVLAPVVDQEIQVTVAQYGFNGSIDASSLLQSIENMAIQRAVTQTGVVELMIEDADKRGMDIADIRAQLEQVGTKLQSWIKPFAVTVTTAAIEGARNAVADRLGTLRKTWHSVHDERVRAAHKVLDGRTVQSQHPFTIGGVQIRYPGDPEAPIGLTINCRCYLTFAERGATVT